MLLALYPIITGSNKKKEHLINALFLNYVYTIYNHLISFEGTQPVELSES